MFSSSKMRSAVFWALGSARCVALQSRASARALGSTRSFTLKSPGLSSRLGAGVGVSASQQQQRRRFSAPSRPQDEQNEDGRQDEKYPERKWSTPLAKQLAAAIEVRFLPMTLSMFWTSISVLFLFFPFPFLLFCCLFLYFFIFIFILFS
jgi:hypothetical protein